MGCDFCLGSVEKQQRVFRRKWVLRAPEKLRDDLIAFSGDPNMEFVSAFHDFVSIPPSSYAETVLDRHYDLNIRIEFFRLPSKRGVELLTGAFRGGKVCFSLDEMHATSPKLPDLDALIARIKQVEATGRFEAWLSYVQSLVRHDHEYAAALRQVVRATGCTPDRVDAWWDLCPTPDAEGLASEEEYQEALRRRNRYYLFNRLFRMSVLAHRVAPRLTNALLRAYSNSNLGSPIKPWNPE